MISKFIAFLAVALLLANCCALGNGCAPASPVAGAPIAWDGLGTAPMDGTEATEPQVRKPARAKREIIVGPLDAAGAGANSKRDSWEEQQAADQDDEAKLKRKLMICQNCR
jgi:hypothetical protein